MVNIENKEQCTGCSACAMICPKNCITMERDEMGFLYPAVATENCVNCHLCESVCSKSTQKAQESSLEAYAVVCKDQTIREKSSSGGVFSLLATYVLSQGGVVFGAAFDETYHSVVHIAVTSVRDLKKLQGSKYLQSRMGNAYAEVKGYLEQGKKVLFTGTPCQTDGLRAYLKTEHENLYVQDIICHGVPAPAVWDAYLEGLERQYGGKAVDISFRDKKDSWKKYSFYVAFDNKKTFCQKSADNLYMRGFLRDYYLRPSCYACVHKGTVRTADITLADFWGVECVCPTLDDDKGTSLVVVHSAKGKQLFETIQQEVICEKTDVHAAVTHNPAMIRVATDNAKRKQFEEAFQNQPIDKLLKSYCDVSFRKKVSRKIKSWIKKK